MGKKSTILVQYGIALAVNLCSMVSGVWLSWPSNVIGPLQRGQLGYSASRSEIAAMVALMDLGNLLTPLPTAFLLNLLGRTRVVQTTALLFLLASTSALLSTGVWWLHAARLLAGMAKGVAYAVVPVFDAEIAEVRVRGALGTIPSLMVGFGTTFTFVLGPWLSFRDINLATLILPAILLVVCFVVPESPYYLVMKGKLKKAKRSLQIYRSNPSEEKLNDEMEIIEKSVRIDMEKKTGFSEVFKSKSSRRALIIIILMSIFQRTAGIGPLMAYSTNRLPETGGGASREVYCMIFRLILISSHNIAMPLVETLGRRKTAILSSLCAALITMTFGVFYHMKNSGVDVTRFNWIPYACLLLFSFSWGIGLCVIPVILIGELFPMNVKSYAGCVASLTYAVSNFATNELFGEIPDGNEQDMFYAFTASSILSALFAKFFLIETKGKTFIEIQELLSEKTDNSNIKSKIIP